MNQPIKRIEFHYATDRRCYDGAFCSDLQKEVDAIRKAKKHLYSLGLHATYFPAGEFWVGFRDPGSQIITQDCKSFEQCYHECIDFIEKECNV